MREHNGLARSNRQRNGLPFDARCHQPQRMLDALQLVRPQCRRRCGYWRWPPRDCCGTAGGKQGAEGVRSMNMVQTLRQSQHRWWLLLLPPTLEPHATPPLHGTGCNRRRRSAHQRHSNLRLCHAKRYSSQHLCPTVTEYGFIQSFSLFSPDRTRAYFKNSFSRAITLAVCCMRGLFVWRGAVCADATRGFMHRLLLCPQNRPSESSTHHARWPTRRCNRMFLTQHRCSCR